MSRTIKMGVAAAIDTLKESGVAVPDAIVTGTAYGCLEDTGVFLSKMVEQQEELLAPTAFIQSTHNTVGAQIALMLNCTGYNNVFVHRAFSFENALLDAMMLLGEKAASNVLVGGIDEITNYSHQVMSRLGLYRREATSNFDLYEGKKKGTMAGEGAAFFLLTDQPSGQDYAMIKGLKTFYKPANMNETKEHIRSFLEEHALAPHDIGLVLTGKNGDEQNDEIYEQVTNAFFTKTLRANYKHLCGEYPTSTAFATWVAASIIQTGTVPAILHQGEAIQQSFSNVLVYNHSHNTHHSLILLAAC